MSRPAFAILAAALALAGCGKPAPDAPVTSAWVRLPAVSGRPGAAYFTLHGGATADALTAMSSPDARKIELHESMTAGGMMTMRALPAVDVPAGGTVVFAPGGNHAMLFDVKPVLQPGATLKLAFAFRSGKTVTVDAKAVAAGDPAPSE